MVNIIPKPAKSEERYGDFVIDINTTIYAEDSLAFARDKFVETVESVCGYRLNVILSPTADINFLVDKKQPREGYIIDCTTEKIHVYASTKAGALYAIQSLRQLALSDLIDNPESLSIHAVYIEDYPKYEWRGLMLDESRHFFGPDAVKSILEMMAFHKLNVFHWHLTDNTGWRIEIKKYPKLTSIGSVRKGTQWKAWGQKDIEWVPYDGFYTQEEIKDIVAYAARLNIMIVPEIDIPAHFAAAIAAYPELGCFNKEIEPFASHKGNNPGEYNIIACAGKDSTFQFVYDVIDELSRLFPAPYFHIGGDEAPKKEWKKCPSCQQVIDDKNLTDEEELQSYMNNKIAVYLKRKGKRLIGWNEILKGKNLERSVIPQYWTYKEDGNVVEWMASGGNVIISKHQAFYFDMPYAQLPLNDTYNFTPDKYGMAKNKHTILGVECTLWTEWISTQLRLDFQMYPRLEAFAEVAWTPDNKKDYDEFLQRLEKFLPTLDKLGKIYCPMHMVHSNFIKKIISPLKFGKRDAHFEFNRAMQYRRRKRVKSIAD